MGEDFFQNFSVRTALQRDIVPQLVLKQAAWRHIPALIYWACGLRTIPCGATFELLRWVAPDTPTTIAAAYTGRHRLDGGTCAQHDKAVDR